MPAIKLYRPEELSGSEPPPLEQFRHRYLAQGDSWFSFGQIPPGGSNLLNELQFSQRDCAVNCARPGATLNHMVDRLNDRNFSDLLLGRRARTWDGILFSGGGNDLIDAAQVLPTGAGAQPSLRLLLTQSEWTAGLPSPNRYLSDAGWTTLSDHMRANFERLLAMRDDPASQSKGCPVFFHTYHFPTPRDAPALAGAFGPWLYKAVVAYAIPEPDWIALARLLVERLADLLIAISNEHGAAGNIRIFDTARQVNIVPAQLGMTGASGDWANEIHLTRGGCRKLGGPWGAAIES